MQQIGDFSVLILVKRSLLVLLMSLAASLAFPTFGAQPEISEETITVDGNAQARPFPHIWEQMFGSGRAVLSLRESYRCDLRAVKAHTEFKYVRFHGIFDDEMGVYDEDAQGKPAYN